MTEGTSQGLFVVVAIVIFGIFIGLAYTVFGSEGLTKDLKGLFTNSIEKTTENIKGYSENMFKMSDIKAWSLKAEERGIIFSKSENEVVLKPNKIAGAEVRFIGGLVIDSQFIEPNKQYSLSFDIEVLDGYIETIGGHIQIAENQTVFLDGSKVDTLFTTGIVLPNDNKQHKIEVVFDSSKMSDGMTDYNKDVYIQPNRSRYYYDYTASIKNIEFREVLND